MIKKTSGNINIWSDVKYIYYFNSQKVYMYKNIFPLLFAANNQGSLFFLFHPHP